MHQAHGPACPTRLTRSAHAVRHALLALTLLTAGSSVFSTPASAADTRPTAGQGRIAYDLAAGPLEQVLTAFAARAGISLTIPPALVAGKASNGLQGSYAIEDGLARILAGSGLEASGSGRAYVVTARPGGEVRLAPVTVTAQGNRGGATEGTGRYTPAGPIGTATPLGLTVRETPQSVSVVTKQRMDDQGLTTVSQVMAQVPGITQYSLGTERAGFNARGYAIDNYQLDGVNTASHNEGLASQASQSAADMAIYDRIEVLRGASGLMSGAGDPSGTINMVRKKPTAEFQGAIEGSLGSWRNKRGMLDLSGPVNQGRSLRGRFVAAWQDGDSFIDHYGNEKKVFYGVLEADLTDSTRLTVGVEHQRGETQGSFAYLGFPLWYSNGARTDLPRAFSPASRDNRFDSRTTAAFATLDQALGGNWRLKVSANRLRSSQLEEAIYLSSNSSFADPVTGDGLSLNADRRNHRLEIDSLDVNVRGPLSLFGRQHDLVFGADYQDFTNYTKGSFDESGRYGAANLHTWDRSGTGQYEETFVTFDNPRRQKSLYAAGRFQLSDRLRLIAGTKVFSYDSNAITQNIAGYYSATPASENSVWTPYGGLVYDIDGTHTAYASYSTIYKPQTAQDRYGALLDPREGANHEIGLKSGWLGGRLNSAVALYEIRQDNLSESDPGYFVPGTTNRASRAVKGAKTRGVDVEVSGALTHNWNISASWTYSETENAKGERIRTIFPRHLAKLWTTYRLPGELNSLTVGGGVNWQSKVYSTVSAWQIGRNLYWEQKPYSVVSLMARYDFDDQLSATLNVNNVFDKKYIASVSDWWYSGMYGAPRSVALNLRYNF
ncbi:TonB-dependent siderophore receptor [Thauera linaloolentis]|uniref:TonB-dependent siderophore receptor n=1 Tax=Thauera linaloolentis (strain DSM 12138 / JCM 21573 / CCUG 41526 / CIP 105981 / IAM 15112 / NBRC 102519 / 47Lol) TaxID=1123367 RepID=N6ZE98_THAL4|nr:TonB-dependent siderophore receptor [Thauera linaloolentis]ENO90489.1 TonB-dependent siderophore receptor [Thauera linaloolentis 47Lol = DSM 12138]MCM8566348.1 TonB-dependent siderophore receptor [Thauera linaloolentis]